MRYLPGLLGGGCEPAAQALPTPAGRGVRQQLGGSDQAGASGGPGDRVRDALTGDAAGGVADLRSLVLGTVV